MQFGFSPSDLGHLPPQFKNCDVQMFLPNGVGITQLQKWVKPRGVSMIHMLCIGAGGGGAGGQSAVNQKGGGGGGSSGGITSLIVPAIFLPDTLSIFVSPGGRGGAAASNGGDTSLTYISLGQGATAGSTIPNIILSANGGNRGSKGNGGGGGGGAASVAIITLGPIGKLGFFSNTGNQSIAGYGGEAGSAGGNGTTFVATPIVGVLNTFPLSGGVGGGGASAANNGLGGGSMT